MDEFRTLRGFVTGEEPDEPPYFHFSATLRIIGDDLAFEAIEAALGCAPTLHYRKGSHRGPMGPVAKFDMWQYSGGLAEDRPLHEHIDAVWDQIRHAASYLRGLKESATVDVFLGYRSNIDTAGFEVPHTSLDMFAALEVPFGVSVVLARALDDPRRGNFVQVA